MNMQWDFQDFQDFGVFSGVFGFFKAVLGGRDRSQWLPEAPGIILALLVVENDGLRVRLGPRIFEKLTFKNTRAESLPHSIISSNV